MTTKTVLIEVEVPEGHDIEFVACNTFKIAAEPSVYANWRLVPPARAVPDEAELVEIAGDWCDEVEKDRDGFDRYIFTPHDLHDFARALLSPPAEPVRAAGDVVSVPRGLLEKLTTPLSRAEHSVLEMTARLDAINALRALLAAAPAEIKQ